jgi:hypothetical protein
MVNLEKACDHDDTVEITTFGSHRTRLLCTRCGTETDGGPR